MLRQGFSRAGAMGGLIMGVDGSVCWCAGKPELLAKRADEHYFHHAESDLALLWSLLCQPLHFVVIGIARDFGLDFGLILAETIPKSILVCSFTIIVGLTHAHPKHHPKHHAEHQISDSLPGTSATTARTRRNQHTTKLNSDTHHSGGAAAIARRGSKAIQEYRKKSVMPGSLQMQAIEESWNNSSQVTPVFSPPSPTRGGADSPSIEEERSMGAHEGMHTVIGKQSSSVSGLGGKRMNGLKKDKANVSMLRKIEESTGHDVADNLTSQDRRRTVAKIKNARAADPIKASLEAFHTERPEDLTIQNITEYDEKEDDEESDEDEEGPGKPSERREDKKKEHSPSKAHTSKAQISKAAAAFKRYNEVIHPDSLFLNAWLMFGILAVCFCIFIGPMRIAFSVQNEGVFLNQGFMQFIYVLLEIYFIANSMFVEFRKGYYDEHTMDLMMERDIIYENYMTWKRFGWECIWSLPFDIINVAGFGCESEVLTVLSLLKICRFRKIVKWVSQLNMGDTLRDIQDRHPQSLRLAELLITFAAIMHIMSCLYWRSYMFVNDNYYLYEMEDEWVTMKDNWKAQGMATEERCYKHNGHWKYKAEYNEAEGTTYTYCGPYSKFVPVSEVAIENQGENADDILKAYSSSMYWSLLVVLGQPAEPGNMTEVVVGGLATVFGMFIFAVVIGNASSVITSMDSVGEARSKQMNAINQYLTFRGVPTWMQTRIREYYDYLWLSGQAAYHKRAFDELPPMLHMQLSLCLKKQMIESSSVFKNLSAASVVAIMDRLHSIIALPDEIIILQDTPGDKMYFLAQGQVKVTIKVDDINTPKHIKYMSRGEAFGEMAILDPDNNVRSCNIVAVSFCELEELSAADVHELLDFYPDIEENLMILEHSRETKRLSTRREGLEMKLETVRENKRGDKEGRSGLSPAGGAISHTLLAANIGDGVARQSSSTRSTLGQTTAHESQKFGANSLINEHEELDVEHLTTLSIAGMGGGG
ncbi:hypothetical protein TL16_g09332 [Triparma laevis f. inornata]|uniref:Cyclic nucleotide-binding domain-containing protein n=1 Tax=Triparma laevis f. inornata TaxID=1714386 RepID=A0A9W7B1H5_9STRA|nr:hypothetical protein TL16_g09332 [Triparma laevis f. inornata]